MGGEELKWRQLAHHRLMSQKGPILVHTVELKPKIKGQISGRMVYNGIIHVAFASVYSEKTRMKKCWIMIIIIINRFDAVSAYMRKMERYGLSDF